MNFGIIWADSYVPAVVSVSAVILKRCDELIDKKIILDTSSWTWITQVGLMKLLFTLTDNIMVPEQVHEETLKGKEKGKRICFDGRFPYIQFLSLVWNIIGKDLRPGNISG